MCGRYASFQNNQDLLDAFLIDPTLPLSPELSQWRESWNVAPTQAVRIVVERPARSEAHVPSRDPDPIRSLQVARWGLVPKWAKDPSIGSRMINARSETAASKPSFRSAFKSRRCLIPADGFYEWHTEPGRAKRPWFFHAADDAPHRWLVTCTILTAESEGEFARFHDRRPVILQPDAWDAWLAPSTTVAQAEELIESEPPSLIWHPVSTEVNSVANNSRSLIAPDADQLTGGVEALFPDPQG